MQLFLLREVIGNGSLLLPASRDSTSAWRGQAEARARAEASQIEMEAKLKQAQLQIRAKQIKVCATEMIGHWFGSTCAMCDARRARCVSGDVCVMPLQCDAIDV